MTDHEETRADDRVRQAYDQAAQALLVAAGQGDEHMLGHSERVSEYCLKVAKQMGLGATDVTNLRYAAGLHDIGKIGVSRNIVNKLGKLTDEEFQAMRLHSIIGIRILEKIDGLRDALPMIKHHHERWDGTGYPDRLSGEDIPLGARIIAVAEAFDILTSDVPWRDGMSPTQAIEEIVNCAGTQFDPAVVECFLQAVAGLSAEEAHNALANAGVSADAGLR